MAIRRLYAALAVIALCAVMVAACDDAEPHPATPAPSGSFGGYSYTGLPDTLRKVAAMSDFIGVIQPLRRIDDWWPANGPQVMSAARFEVKVVSVEKGDVSPGDTFVIHALGGSSKKLGSADGQFKPGAGDETVGREDPTRPYYSPGVEEFVFLERIEDPDAGEFYFDLGLGSRFRIDGVRLSVVGLSADARADAAKLRPVPFWLEFDERSLADISPSVQEVIRLHEPKPTEEP
jgi:hypothetical protein